jgi:hypothetical protein
MQIFAERLLPGLISSSALVQAGPVVPKITLSSSFVPENSAIGTLIGTLSVLKGSGSYTFTKISDPDGIATLTGNQLKLAKVPDFEDSTGHNVTIHADNGAGSIAEHTFLISIGNVLEGTLAPSTASFTVDSAPGTPIVTITGLDIGANEQVVSVSPNDGRLAVAGGNQIVVGLSASSAGTINASVTTSAGRTLSLTLTAKLAPTYVALWANGQSNMRGNTNAVNVDPVLDAPDPRILQWSLHGGGDATKSQVLLQATEPLLHGTDQDPTWGPGLEMQFARQLLPTLQSHQKIVILPCAINGTPISTWLPPSGANWVDSVACLSSFFAAYPDSTCPFILNLQGEADVLASTDPATYKTQQDQMFAAMRAADPRCADATIIAGQMLLSFIQAQASGPGIDHVHRTMPLRIRNSWFSPEVDDVGKRDSVHYGVDVIRNLGAHMATHRDRARFLADNLAPVPTNVALEARTIKFGSSDAPAYVIQTSPIGQNNWTDTEVYPYKFNVLGDTLQFDIPGTGEVDVRVKSRCYKGDSDPTQTLTYRVPVIQVPQAVWDLDFANAPVDANGFVTSVPSVGSDATAWSPVGSIPRAAINGKNALDVTTSGMQLKRNGVFPNGTYTHLFAFFSQYEAPNSQTILSFGDNTNYGPTTLTPKNIAHVNVSQIDIAYTATLAQGKFYCFAWQFDGSDAAIAAGNNGAILINAVEKVRGKVKAQQYTATNQRLFGRFSDATTGGLRGRMMAFKSWNSLLTADQIGAVMGQIAKDWGVQTWG